MTRRAAALGPGLALVAFWVASLSVGFAAFVALAFLSRRDDTGALADASAVLSVSFVLAVVPGAIQLRAAAAAAVDAAADSKSPEDAAGVPVALVAWISGGLLVASPAIAVALTVPWLGIALLIAQLPVACLAAVQRGTAIGREEYGRASASMGIDAAFRLIAGAGLGLAFGAAGLAAALLLGTVAAAELGRRWYARGLAAPASSVVGPALTVGILMVLINLDVLAAPRVLGAAAADAYAVAELPAKGVFFALFAVSWLAVPIAARARRASQLLVPIGAVLGIGLVATAVLAVARPLLPMILGDAAAPPLELLVLLALAMTVAAALATALAMAVARDAAHPWAPSLFATMMLGIVIVVLEPNATDLAGLVLLAQAVALGGTAFGLLRTIGARALPAAGRPLAATP
ncbi:MAG: hypothetical protein Q7T55_26100 [Solirubrobacteraceae bacterium]|nr:hypothetical protein [Solirubrobacteraceae bacterium]